MRESYFRGENFTERAKRNLFILDAIRRRGPISKTDISSLIGLNVVTISNYVDELLHQKIIFEKEYDISKGGRRPLLLDLNRSAGYALGVGVNLLNTVGVITDLSGRIITKTKREKSPKSAKEAVDCIISIISELLGNNSDMHSRIKGIGIGIAGVVDFSKEKVRWPERVGDSYHYVDVTVPLKDILEREFGFPVSIDNDATLACFGEQWLALESDIQNLIYMFSGASCGFILNNEIFRGSSGCAGEVAIHSDKRQTPYFLARWESDLSIREDYLKNLKWSDESKESGVSAQKDISLKEIFDFAKKGESPALEVIKSAGQRLGMRIAYLVNLLNPEMVVIGGGIEEAGIPLIEEIKETVNECCFEESAQSVRVVPSRLGEDAVVLGAASLIIRKVFAELNC